MRSVFNFKFETNKCIKDCKMPIVIFHGDMDIMIQFDSSIRLKKLMKPGDQLIPLPLAGHNGMSDNKDYLKKLKKILSN